ncbi:MAG TPA: cysteine desulfurase [Xanthobacteraceae bacterium]|nr:cysteine desulfurase [Xanthobacteraceae bacterium]
MNAPAKPAFDIAKVRADFPILSKEVYGKKLVYLDNAASAQKPKAVLERMRYCYEHEYANVHRGLHYLANAATEAYEGAREKVRGFLNAKSASEIIFVKNATEAINLAAASFGLAEIGEGDEIVLSIMEHHSNIVPWHYHRERKGAVIKWAPVDEDGNFLLDEFEKLLTRRTKIVAITQMSNALGTIVPVKEVVKIAHARGIPVLVDGSQGAVHLTPDVQDIDADFYVFTGHKLYGPSGIGVLYAKREWLERLPPFLGGGEMIREVTEENVTYGDPPHKFEAGKPAIVPAVGLGAAIDYVQSLGHANIAAHEKMLLDYATEKLARINSLKFYGRAKEKGAILSFEMKGTHPHDVATVIDRQGVAVRAGTHCALPLLKRYGCTATCRASFALYNTKEEVDALAEALLKAQEMFA